MDSGPSPPGVKFSVDICDISPLVLKTASRRSVPEVKKVRVKSVY